MSLPAVGSDIYRMNEIIERIADHMLTLGDTLAWLADETQTDVR